MIISYSKEQFKNKILAGIKITTIRKDANNRWRPGMMIQHWLHNPRNVSKMPHQFGEDECISTQTIDIIWDEFMFQRIPHIFIDGMKILDKSVIEQIAINDGFESSKSFFKWFNKDIEGWKIIHWTGKKY